MRQSYRLASESDAATAWQLADAMVLTVAQPLLVLNGELTVLKANPAFHQLFKVNASVTVGRRLFELGNHQWDIPELRALLETLFTRSQFVENYRVEHDFEEIGRRVMLLNGRRIGETSQHPRLILLAISDVTEQERTRFELEGQKEFAEKLIDSIRESLLVLGWDLRVKTANQSFYECFRVSREETEGRLVYDLGNGQWNIPRLRHLLDDILPKEESFDDFEVQHTFEHLGRRTMLLNARRLDHLDLIVLAIRDVTDQHRHEREQKALMGELQHRVKNILASVQALARVTLKGSRSLNEFETKFQARLHSLRRTQDLLVRSPSDRVELHDLVQLELESHGAERVCVDGPRLELSAKAAQAMAMMLHELITNAAKHGAIATGGTIAVTWRTESLEDPAQFSFFWREHGVTTAPKTKASGFGSEIIEHAVPYTLGGTARLTFHPDGAECRLMALLSRIRGQSE
jgi:two-component sensor histidine kinase